MKCHPLFSVQTFADDAQGDSHSSLLLTALLKPCFLEEFKLNYPFYFPPKVATQREISPAFMLTIVPNNTSLNIYVT